MLWFVGMGVAGPQSMPAGALELLRAADAVYLESFTSPVGGADVEEIRRMAGGRFIEARRWQVEDGRAILDDARDGTAVLLSYGDPYVATTHIELRTRALGEGIAARCIHAASAPVAAVGECGLHHYKVGRTATVMADPASHATPCRTVSKNLAGGNHSVLLLEYDEEGGFFLDPAEAIRGLLGAEGGLGRGTVTGRTYVIVASRVGLEGQGIVAGSADSMAGHGFGGPPHTVIIPAEMHFTESEALASVATQLDAPPGSWPGDVPAQMVGRYAPMVREALEEVRPRCAGRPELAPVLENAGLYVRDAERFLEEGRGEVAVLSIGYADGLVDALRMSLGMDPKM